jgi:hypothetical protein
MTVLEINHLDKNGKILYKNSNLKNILHTEGEEYILKALFGGISLVQKYYIGLDTRSTLGVTDSFFDIPNVESNGPGYSRQEVNNTSFTVSISSGANGRFQANSPIVSFRSTGSNWRARNIFMATALSGATSGTRKLISSVPLGSNLLISEGELITMRIGLALQSS